MPDKIPETQKDVLDGTFVPAKKTKAGRPKGARGKYAAGQLEANIRMMRAIFKQRMEGRSYQPIDIMEDIIHEYCDAIEREDIAVKLAIMKEFRKVFFPDQKPVETEVKTERTVNPLGALLSQVQDNEGDLDESQTTH